MSNDHSEAIVTETRNYLKPLLITLLSLIFVISGYRGYLLYMSSVQTGDASLPEKQLAPVTLLSAEEIARITAEVNSRPYEYVLVPNALEKIVVKPPVDSVDTDQQVYDSLRPTDPTVSPITYKNNHVYSLPFKGGLLGDYVNSLSDPSEFFQINDELTHLTQYYNNLYKRKLLAERISGVVEYTIVEPALQSTDTQDNYASVYPSIRAVAAYAAGEMMSRFDPVNRDVYEAEALTLVKKGISYGLYGQSDAEASLSLVSQYFTLLDSREADASTNDDNQTN